MGRKRAIIVLKNGKRIKGRFVSIAPDITSWIDTSDEAHSIATSEIEEIRFGQGKSRYSVYSLAVLLAGAVAIFGRRAIKLRNTDNDDKISDPNKTTSAGIALVSAQLLGATLAKSKPYRHKYVFKPGRQDFPWPPPSASAIAAIPISIVSDAKPRISALVDTLVAALLNRDYSQPSYHKIPGNGLAIVTSSEQINDLGHSVAKQRWSCAVESVEIIGFLAWLNAIFLGPEVHCRIFVFVLTTERFVPGDANPSDLLWIKGQIAPPVEIMDLQLSDYYIFNALIYEFKEKDVDERPRFVNRNQSSLTGLEHLKRSGIWKSLRLK